MHARVTRVRLSGPPIAEERLLEARALMKAVSRMSGHRGAVWLVDRATGEGLALDLYEELEDLDNTRQGDLRDELIATMGATLVGVEEYEVAGLDRILEG